MKRSIRRQGLTLVPISAQLELTLPLSAQLKLTLSPLQPNLTHACVPKVLKLSSNVSVCSEGPQVELCSERVSAPIWRCIIRLRSGVRLRHGTGLAVAAARGMALALAAAAAAGAGLLGRAVQVDPIKPTLKASGTKCLKL
jgi:hypothetical protein